MCRGTNGTANGNEEKCFGFCCTFFSFRHFLHSTAVPHLHTAPREESCCVALVALLFLATVLVVCPLLCYKEKSCVCVQYQEEEKVKQVIPYS
jgi:hypothetical protein